MADFIVAPSVISGKLAVPPSKSQTLRALLFGFLGEGKTEVLHPLDSPDTRAMVQAIRLLGARVDETKDQVTITGTGGRLSEAQDVIDAGNSGIVLRFVAAVAAISSYPIVVTGDHSIRYQRPMEPLLSGLQQLGAKGVSTKKDGFAPVIIEGPLVGGAASVSGQDSQPVSALLIASCFSKKGVVLDVQQPGEMPWVAMTLSWLDRLGLEYDNEQFVRYRVRGNQAFHGFSYAVPGDFSSAAFPLIAALATKSCLEIGNLDFQDAQGDKQLIAVLQEMGADIAICEAEKKVVVGSKGCLKGGVIDCNAMIDAVPALAVAACFAEGRTLLVNAAIARHKESNRLYAIAHELAKMGAKIRETADGLEVHPSALTGSDKLFSHHDHRIAMALAAASLAAVGKSRIFSVECVQKTYPSFAEEFRKMGANIEIAACG